MGVDHLGAGGLAQEIQRIWRELRRVAKATLNNGSIGGAGLRVYGGGEIRFEQGGGVRILGDGYIDIDGNLTGAGDLSWTGPWDLAGLGTVTGDATFTGTMTVNGPWDLNGNGDIAGNVTLDGDLTLGTGRIVAGPVTIDKLGAAGGRIASSGQMIVDGLSIYLGASTTVNGPLGVSEDLNVSGMAYLNGGLNTTGSKNFRMEHPLKPGYWLHHGSTESPISGTEYTGRATIGPDGSVDVELPDYFEALNKPGNRTVQVTPLGKPFQIGADEVLDGKVTIYGEPGRDVFWLVKAERYGGDFLLEQPISA